MDRVQLSQDQKAATRSQFISNKYVPELLVHSWGPPHQNNGGGGNFFCLRGALLWKTLVDG